MTLTWAITSLDIIKTDIDNRQIVRNIGWKLTGTDSGVSYTENGKATNLALPSGTYTEYDSLTESDVIGWLKSHLGSSEVTFIENKVTEEVNSLLYSIEVEENKTLPW